MQEKNEIVHKIRLAHSQTIEKRKEVNDLKLKSKLISENEVNKQFEDADETLMELPEEIKIEEDEIIAKLSEITKSSK